MSPYISDDPDDLMRWPSLIAVISTDMAQPYWPEFDLSDFTQPSAQSDARKFVVAWRKTDGSNLATYRQQLIKLLDGFFAHRTEAIIVADQIVHEALRHRNLSAELDIWQGALCARAASLQIVDVNKGQCETAVEGWCTTAARLARLVDEMFELHPRTSWDRWLCSVEGFYGDREFLANVQAGTIAQWRIIKNLQAVVHSGCSGSEAAAILARATSSIDRDGSKWITLEL
jgi:hypothetical protein